MTQINVDVISVESTEAILSEILIKTQNLYENYTRKMSFGDCTSNILLRPPCVKCHVVV